MVWIQQYVVTQAKLLIDAEADRPHFRANEDHRQHDEQLQYNQKCCHNYLFNYRLGKCIGEKKLRFEASDRNHIHAVFAAICVLTNAGDNHHERRCFHLCSVNLACQIF